MNKNKLKLFIGILVCLFILSSISLPINNVLAEENHSDDSDIEATLHSRLETDSDEIIIYNSGAENESLTPGTFDFFEQPELDVGSFSHDLTRVNVEELQYADESSNSKKSGSMVFPINQTWNHTTNSIPEYDISAPKDTTISTNIGYNFTNIIGTRNVNIVPIADSTPCDGTPTPPGSHYSTVDEGNSPNTGDYVQIKGDYWERNWQYETYYMEDVELGDGEYIYDIKVWIYGREYSDVADYYIWGASSIDPSLGSTWYSQVHETYDWVYVEWSNLYITDMSDFQLKIQTRPGESKNWWDYYMRIASVYCTVYIKNGSRQETPFKAVQVNNFEYQVLGTNYTQTFNITYNPSESNYIKYKETGVLAVYYFTSTILDNYDHISNLKILNQTLILTFYFWFSGVTFQYSMNISWSLNEWRYPTEIDLEINGNEVIDEDVATGYVYLLTYPSNLIITSSSSNIYFKLNITVDFSFIFNLEIISKTILRKSFKLLSDHLIYIDRINFNSNLNIKRILLNNIDEGNSNPCYLSPPVEMDTNKIFNLEVI